MSKKPVAYKGMMGGITYESAVIILKFLRNEADMDDDLSTVEYYNGMLLAWTLSATVRYSHKTF